MAIDYDFKQTDSAKQPGYESNLASNRVPTMVFDGGDVMASADLWRVLGDKQACTIYLIVDSSNTSGAPRVLYCEGGGKIQIYYNPSIGSVFLLMTDDSGDLIGNIGAVVGSNGFDKKVICFRNSGFVDGADGGCSSFVDGVKVTDTDFNTGDSVTLTDAVTYFGGEDATPTNAFVGQIPGIWVASVAHTDAEVSEYMEYLQDTYGVQGWDYNGTSSVTTVADDPVFDLSGDWSIGGWVKLDALDNDYAVPLAIGNFGATPSINIEFKSSDSELYAQCKSDTKPNVTVTSGVNNPGDSREWQYILLEHDDTANTLTLYIDNIQVGQQTSVDFDSFTFGVNAIFGDSRSRSSAELDGTLRDWACWNNVLSSDDKEDLAAGMYAADTATNSPVWNLTMLAEYDTTPVTVGVEPSSLSVTNTNVTGVYK